MSYSGKIYTSVPDLVGKQLAKAQAEYEAKDAVEVSPAQVWKAGSVASTMVEAIKAGLDVAGPEPRDMSAAVKNEQGRGFMQCPNCNGWTVIKQDCPTCRDCGWSKCS